VWVAALTTLMETNALPPGPPRLFHPGNLYRTFSSGASTLLLRRVLVLFLSTEFPGNNDPRQLIVRRCVMMTSSRT